MKNPFRGLRFSLLDFHNARAGLGMKMAFAAICCIPLIYGALYLAAFYDPYGNIDKVPVVVVNKDKGWEVEGETLEAGDAVVDQLKDADALDFTYDNDEEAARDGLERGIYYMELIIPEDFSECVASASTDAPKQARFELIANQSANSIATTMGLSAFRVITSKVNYAIGEDFYVSIFDMIDGSTAAIKVAADGSAELADGLVGAQEGSQTITDALGTASTGAGALDSGLGQLSDGLSAGEQGANALASGLDQLEGGSDQLAGGTAALLGQLDSQAESMQMLASTAGQVSSGVSALRSALNGMAPLATKTATDSAALQTDLTSLSSLATTIGGLKTQVTNAGNNITAASGQIQTAISTLETLKSSEGLRQDQKDSIDAAISALRGNSDSALDSGSALGQLSTAGQTLTALGSVSTPDTASLQTHADAVSADLSSIQTALSSLAPSDGSPDQLALLEAGAVGVARGTATVQAYMTTDAYDASGNPTTLHAAVSALNSGAQQLANGVSTASNGAGQLAAGTSQLAAGATAAESGAAALAQGLVQLADGSATLTEGLGSATDGAQALADGLAEGVESAEEATENADQRAEMMSEPVDLEQSEYTTVTNYGSGFAPYFIALGLWVGALMCTFIVKPLNGRLISSGATPVVAAFAGLVPSVLIGLIQALLMAFVLQFGLHIDLLHPAAYYGLCLLTAVCFAAWNQMLVATLGLPGKFLSVVLLMLQLTSAAGTFPIEVVPDFFQAINPLLPMTYAVRALRVATTGVDMSMIGPNVLALIVFAAIPFALTTLLAARKRLITLNDLHPLVELG